MEIAIFIIVGCLIGGERGSCLIKIKNIYVSFLFDSENYMLKVYLI